MISQNLKSINKNIPENVCLVAVSKFKPIEDIEQAYKAGQKVFAESRPIEMKEKFDALPKDIKWHFIGHLQTNKIKYIIEFVELIQSVDSIKLIDAINENAKKIDRKIDILLEVFVAQENTKQGFNVEDIQKIFTQNELLKYSNVNVVGIMAMATFTENYSQIEQEFLTAKKLFDNLNANGAKLNTLSMGMSGDYKVAIKCGSNLVRIGSSIFGDR